MSVQEIQSQISRLTSEEKLEIEAFLRAQRLARSSEFKQSLKAAHERIDAGSFVTLAELKALLSKRRKATS